MVYLYKIQFFKNKLSHSIVINPNLSGQNKTASTAFVGALWVGLTPSRPICRGKLLTWDILVNYLYQIFSKTSKIAEKVKTDDSRLATTILSGEVLQSICPSTTSYASIICDIFVIL